MVVVEGQLVAQAVPAVFAGEVVAQQVGFILTSVFSFFSAIR
jgi:hypothetical protein